MDPPELGVFSNPEEISAASSVSCILFIAALLQIMTMWQGIPEFSHISWPKIISSLSGPSPHPINPV